jgi:hypothetical protein
MTLAFGESHGHLGRYTMQLQLKLPPPWHSMILNTHPQSCNPHKRWKGITRPYSQAPALPWHANHNTQGMAISAVGFNHTAHCVQKETSIRTNRPNIQIPALIPRVRCYVDASTTPDHPSLPPGVYWNPLC